MRPRALTRDSRERRVHLARIAAVWSETSSAMSKRAARLVARVEVRQRRRVARRAAAAARHAEGRSASSVTTQGETVVAKFLARNGPSGWYSHFCMSRADQSLRRHRPKIVSARPRRSGCGVAERVAAADEDAELQLVVEQLARAEGRASRRRAALRLAAAGGAPACRSTHDRRGAAVVADRHVLVVGQQRVVGPEHRADVGRVVHARRRSRCSRRSPPAAASRPSAAAPAAAVASGAA